MNDEPGTPESKYTYLDESSLFSGVRIEHSRIDDIKEFSFDSNEVLSDEHKKEEISSEPTDETYTPSYP